MKKNFYLFAAAALVMASCSSDDYVGENLPDGSDVQNPIEFSSSTPNMSRATGAAAATDLHNRFIVWGEKGNAQTVFNNYQVAWLNNPNSTTSNTHGWEYVGLLPYTKIGTAETSETQTIKYWDTNASYKFSAISVPTNELTCPAAADDKVMITKTTGADGYELTLNDGATYESIYLSDLVTDVTQSPVTLTFRSMASKIRIGFYELVPGYNVHVDGFYFNQTQNQTIAGVDIEHPVIGDSRTYKVTYDTQNVAQLEETSTTGTTIGYVGFGSVITGEEFIAEASASATLEEYVNVLPNPENEDVMTLKVDYTLTSTDGTGETIKVKGVSVNVPAEFLQWQPNFAYTYIFKISDATGTLQPITFDAVVEENQTTDQQTVTTVSGNSVTTYANGTEVEEQGNYNAGDIYAVVTDNTGSVVEVTEGDVLAAAATENTAGVYLATIPATGSTISSIDVLTEKNILDALKAGLTLDGTTYKNKDVELVKVSATATESIPLQNGRTLTVKNALKFAAVAQTAKRYVYIHKVGDKSWDVKVINVTE